MSLRILSLASLRGSKTGTRVAEMAKKNWKTSRWSGSKTGRRVVGGAQKLEDESSE